jgi:membrane fusion protein (multidrug efflux system)
MTELLPAPVPADPYRVGYREGFHDGFGEGAKTADRHDDGTSEKDKADSAKEDKDKDDDKGKGKDETKDDPAKQSKDDKPPIYKRPMLVAIVLLVVLVLIIVAIVFWRNSRHHESTDDAFIDGYTSQVAAQTAGQVTHLYVNDNQLVKAGDPLLDIDSRDTDARVQQQRAQLISAQGQVEQAEAQVGVQRASAAQADAAVRQSQAQLTKAEQDLGRYRVVDPEAVPRQEYDNAESADRTARARLDADKASANAARAQVEASLAQVRAARSNVQAAQAQLDAANLQGSYTHVTAPIDGRVTRRSVDVGNVVANGQGLIALVSENLWVTANYKETQLTRMQPGQEVEITVDAFPDVKFRGHVDSIQRSTGQYFSMLPAENATGNYVKVVQRVPVKIVFDDDHVKQYTIGPGMSVSPDVSLP